MSCSTAELAPKRLEILKEMLVTPRRMAIVWHAPERGSTTEWQALLEAGPSLGLELVPVPVHELDELDAALASAKQQGVEAVSVLGSTLAFDHRAEILGLLSRHHLPAIFPFREYPRDGGLVSYGTNVPGMFRHAATHMDRVLRGAKPAEVPVERPTIFDFVIHLKAAQSLGRTIPKSVLQQATEILHQGPICNASPAEAHTPSGAVLAATRPAGVTLPNSSSTCGRTALTTPDS
jgi:putative tryptophan/tyrosine transport system substrate-binding protein